MNNQLRLAFVAAAIAAISACGGGGDDDPVAASPAPAAPPVAAPPAAPPVAAPPAAPTTTAVAIKVTDGVVQNALVCLDTNKNGACDASELQGRTGTTGLVTLQVPNADVGKYPVLASVGTDAVDADSGAVTTAYMLKAPADRPAVVSPWTTLVQEQVAGLGLSTAEAATLVQSQAGLQVSPLSDYAADRSANANSALASSAARALVVAMQQQLQALLPLAGQADAGGVAMTAADIHAAVHDKLSAMAVSAVSRASRVGTACSDPTGVTCNQAITAAGAAMAGEVLLKPATLPQFAEVRRLFAAAAQATGPTRAPDTGFTLEWVNAGDANNWYYRALITPASGGTPDANGLYAAIDQRRSNVNGTISDFSWVNDPARQGDTHWTGSTWMACAVGSGSKLTALDAGGLNRTDNCDKLNTAAIRRLDADISGKPMADVLARIRATRVGAAAWGAAPAWYTGGSPASVGSAVFPAGSALVHRDYADLDNAITYDARAGFEVKVSPAATAAGGDARNGGTPACSVVANQTTSDADTLETVIARFRGTPCVFDQATVIVGGNEIKSPNPNEWSGQSTLSIGVLGSAPIGVTPRTAFMTTNTLIRVAFTGVGQTTYYGCLQRWNDGSPRNCTAIGTGGYTISTLGDARVLMLTNVPAQAAPLGYQRMVVERAGKVYFGFRNNLASNYVPRLNGTAGNALLTQLGMPAVAVP